ncbi:hypothetical protein E3P92_02119 [Wallemia ichthyophaga]|nr:hypothetical protein E3P92_02119 [Wallemia ichthyophaga]
MRKDRNPFQLDKEKLDIQSLTACKNSERVQQASSKDLSIEEGKQFETLKDRLRENQELQQRKIKNLLKLLAIEGTFDEKRQAKETICSANLYSIGNEETEAASIRIDAASTSDKPADLIKTPELEDQFVEYKDEEEDEFYAAAKGLTDDVAINRMAIVFQL